MLAVTGYRSNIITELRKLLPTDEAMTRIDTFDNPPVVDRYVLAGGYLAGKKLLDQNAGEVNATIFANLLKPMALCGSILAENPMARICILGSESGFAWSHDDTYAAAKCAIHKYVETKKLGPQQQLICIAPSIIRNAGMTERRTDLVNLEQRRLSHPKKRFLQAIEVARLIHFLLYVDEGYLSGQVIRMNGGV